MGNPKVLIVATSRKTRGGITSVIKAHETGEQWKKYQCMWLATHLDRGLFVKLIFSFVAFIRCIFVLPQYDLVHFHVGEVPSALRKCPFMWYAKLWRKKTVVHFHTFTPEGTVQSWRRGVYNYLFCSADRVIVLSEFWRDFVEKEFPGAKAVIIYNPCTAEVKCLNSAFDVLPPNAHSILYAGTLSERKGYADLMRAFAKIAKMYPDWKLSFAGNDVTGKAVELVKELGIELQVELLGWVSGDVKDKAFKDADVFCLPSYAEGFPMGVLDAWAYGLPVITTPVGGIPDVAIDGKNMLLFNPGDIEGLANCLERIITDEDLRKSIAKESINFAVTTFNIDTINRNVGLLYEELLEG